VGLLITKDGKFLTSCAINPHEARVELVGGPRRERGETPAASLPSTLGPEEILDRPEGCEDNALSKFIQRITSEHKVEPDHIVVFRDGVAGSQLDAVRDYEVQQVLSAVPHSKITYMVIQKGIHTRFFIEGSQGVASLHPVPYTMAI